MRAFILLADAARAHPDNTFSILRGGIERVNTPRNEPIQFRGAFVARIRATMNESGAHEFRVRVVNEDGQSVAPDITGTFNVPEGGGAVQLVADFAFILPRYGRYTFSVAVDRQELDTWDLHAVEAKPETQATH